MQQHKAVKHVMQKHIKSFLVLVIIIKIPYFNNLTTYKLPADISPDHFNFYFIEHIAKLFGYQQNSIYIKQLAYMEDLD